MFTSLKIFAIALAMAIPIAALSQTAEEDFAYASTPFDRAAFFEKFESKTIEVNGKQFHYVVGGAGEPLLLIHGWPETWYSWRHIMEPLAENFRVIAIDMPGFGASTALENHEKQTVARHIGTALDQIGIDKVHIVGHDMGGPVTYAFASLFPDRVDRIVFSETAIPGYYFADETQEDILSINRDSVGGVWHFPFFMNVDAATMLVQGKEREFLMEMTSSSFTNPELFTEDEIKELMDWMTSPNGARSGFEYYEALYKDADANRNIFVEKLTHPVLTMDGGDGFLQYVTSRSVGKIAANIESVVVPNSGHFIAAERPLFVAQTLTDFLIAE